jgi:hypothetical protein
VNRIAVLLAFILGAAATSAAGPVPQKRIDVLEKAFDATMVESSNALVRQGSVAAGVYIDGYGVIFKMEFTFVDRPSIKLLDNLDNIDSLKEYWRGVIREDDEEGEAAAKRRREQLDGVRSELIETLMDYGGTLTTLRDEERITIIAFPWEKEWDVSPAPVRLLRISARFGDIREYAENRTDEEAVRSRISVVEETR